MRCRELLRAGLGLVVVAAWGIGPSPVRAQYPVASGTPIVMTSPVVATSAPVVVTTSPVVATSPPGVGRRGITDTAPPFSEARRTARTANRYTVARPVYAGRPGVSFAPYSDYYFPRVIGAKETVYTAAPDAPVPVGYRVFKRPNPYPVFPR